MIGKNEISHMLLSSARTLEAGSDELSHIDSTFGDGDHGITIKKISKLITVRVGDWTDESIKDFIDDLGMGIMEVRGGSAGPLYGTMIGGMAVGLHDGEEQLDADSFKRMFAASLSEMRDITTADVGDKTMMDALIPAVSAAQAAQGDERDILRAAADAAQAGVAASAQFIAKFGRAKSYGDKTIGTPDAGAMSTAMFFKGFSEGAEIDG